MVGTWFLWLLCAASFGHDMSCGVRRFCFPSLHGVGLVLVSTLWFAWVVVCLDWSLGLLIVLHCVCSVCV